MYIFIDVTFIDQFYSVYIEARLNKDLFGHGQNFCPRSFAIYIVVIIYI